MTCCQCGAHGPVPILTKHGIPLLRCSACRQVFSGYAPDQAELEHRYANYYSDANTSVNWVTRARYLGLLEVFRPYRKSNRILDIGCGFGFFLATAREDGWDTYGTELSRSASRYLEKMGIPSDHVFIGEAWKAKFDDGSFDVVTMLEVIEHLPDPARAIREVGSLLRRGGLLYLTTPNFNSLSRYLLRASWSIIQPEEHLSYFTVETVRRLLAESGYEIRSLHATGLNYYEVLNRYVLHRKGSGYASLQKAREEIERHGTLRAFKRGADSILSLAGLGDTIKVFAEKQGHKVLYVSYDGALDPLGRSQIVPYLERMGGRGIKVSLLTFEKPSSLADDREVAKLDATLQGAGVQWHWKRYHKWPALLMTVWDVLGGVARGLWIARRARVTIIHARSYIAALIGLLIKRLTGATFVFDMRGFWADERVDGGFWRRESWFYRVAKYLEKRLLLGADGIVSLTHRGLTAVGEFPYMKGQSKPTVVIPTCVDLRLFRLDGTRNARRLTGLEGRFVVGYLGSLGTWYLFDEIVDFFFLVKSYRPETFLSLVVNADGNWVRERLKARCVTSGECRVDFLRREEVPQRLSTFDVSLLFYKAGWSRKATCPTKLGESLACGVPVVATAGIGDVDEFVTKYRVGVILRETTPSAYEEAWRELGELLAEGPKLRARCREVAKEHFSLETGVERYLEFYERVVSQARQQ